MKTKLIALGVVIALAAGGTYGYQQHQKSELIATIAPSVKNASIRVSNAAKLDTDSSNITFKELFDRLEADTAEIDKRNIDIQSLSNKDNALITEPVVAYMRDCQEFSRAMSMKYRKGLAFTNAIDAIRRATDDIRTAGTYGLEYAKTRSDRAIEEAKKASEEADESKRSLVAAAKRLKDSRSKMTSIVADDALVSITQLDSVIKENSDDKSTSADKAKAKS